MPSNSDKFLPIHGLQAAEPEQHQTSKESVVYMDGDQGPFRCDHCEYFIPPNACNLVKGFIDPAGCCNLFEKDED